MLALIRKGAGRWGFTGTVERHGSADSEPRRDSCPARGVPRVSHTVEALVRARDCSWLNLAMLCVLADHEIIGLLRKVDHIGAIAQLYPLHDSRPHPLPVVIALSLHDISQFAYFCKMTIRRR